MGHGQRAASEFNIYHVTARGVGRQLIFEDDIDRQQYIKRLLSALKDTDCSLLAWCLMGNHVHLLLMADLEGLSRIMLKVNGGYGRYFNKRHERVGHLFQDRFSSMPVASDPQLMATVRYIHRNPTAGGMADYETYAWSSYREYVGAPFTVDTTLVLGVFGSVEEFVSFHRAEENTVLLEPGESVQKLDDESLIAFASSLVDGHPLAGLKSLPKSERNEYLRRLRTAGLTIRQIERITSIGRGIIARA